jgi:hypothetical protein
MLVTADRLTLRDLSLTSARRRIGLPRQEAMKLFAGRLGGYNGKFIQQGHLGRYL